MLLPLVVTALVVNGRRPLLARVTGNGEDVPAEVHPSALGRAVLDQLGEISRHYSAVKVISQQLMPDHLHFILYVQERIPCHLSHIINGYKGGCTRTTIKRQQCHALNDMAAALATGLGQSVS